MDYNETLARWLSLKLAITNLQGEERALREGIFNGSFKKPKEGVNKLELSDGRTLKGTHKLNRKVDQEGAASLPPTVREAAFKTELKLKTSDYRKLSDAKRKQVDKVLTITPGLPTLEIVPAKPSADQVAP